jgi:hypothetical protein
MAGPGGHDKSKAYFALRAAVEADVTNPTAETRLDVLQALQVYQDEERKLEAIIKLDDRVRRRMRELTERAIEVPPAKRREWLWPTLAFAAFVAFLVTCWWLP